MIINKRTLIIICAIVFAFETNIAAQPLPDSTIKKIDHLFAKWNSSGSPGCTVGIVRNDSLIFSKGYGMANLEYGIPNEPQTLYHMASVSKQFTAFSIIILARQGKLNLDDDVHKWLPWFPDLKEKITIQNLLNHTSGIRDQWQLLAIAGTRLEDVITQDQIIKILSKQQALNFKPGDKYSYSNSGFTMLAEIVKAVSGQTLRQFTDSAIFKPLGMTSTHIHDDYTEIERKRSYSYGRKDSSHFVNAVLSYSVSGATSLFTNIDDMSKWVMNFDEHKVGDQQDIQMLTLKGKLNNGKELAYARGIVNDTWKGWRQYSHGGADAGYRTYVAVFPDLKMGFMVFGNLADFNPGKKVYELADLFIQDTTASAKGKEKRNNTAPTLNIRSEKFTSNFTGEIGSDQKSYIQKYIPDTSPADDGLEPYTGVYYCPELDCRYGIVLRDNNLFLTNSKYNDSKLVLIGKDHLMGNTWWMNQLMMLRDSKNNIVGFEVNSDRVMHLRFNKIN
jgi:CubicO group peptidase (beta-lactamase class C family)